MDSVQSMASSSSSSVPSSKPSSHYISQTEMEMESAKARHWSQLDYATTDSELSAESNLEYFALLKEDPQWGRFFTDFERLEVGKKISEGAQADIYEARNTCDGPFDLVVKVMKGDAPLKTFQAQWPIGMLSARSKYKHLFDLPLITILGGMVLRDERLRGRFAFVMYRRWGDLRLLIDRRMKQERNTPGPFPIDQAIHLMSTIARDMDVLHNKHDIIHRDLKASNVLVWGELGGDMSLVATLDRAERIGSVVADFECSVGVMGTWFWMAPEILEQLKAGVPYSEVWFTLGSDVYSYGMTCYEIVTGCIPYEGLQVKDTISQILQGQRPELPHDLPEFVRNIIVSCWHSNPLERPNFSAICMALQEKRGLSPMIVVDNKSISNASVVKVEKWNHREALSLLEVMQILMDMDLSIMRAFDLSSATMIIHYFEVINCKGRKVVKDKSIANIKKALSLPVMHHKKWIMKSLQMTVAKNTLRQMHVIEVVAEWSVVFLAVLSRLLVVAEWSVVFLAFLSRLLVVAEWSFGFLAVLSRLLVGPEWSFVFLVVLEWSFVFPVVLSRLLVVPEWSFVFLVVLSRLLVVSELNFVFLVVLSRLLVVPEWNFVFLIVISRLLVVPEWSFGSLAVLSRLLVVPEWSFVFLVVLSRLLVVPEWSFVFLVVLSRLLVVPEWNFVFLVVLSTLLVFAEWSAGFLAVLSRLLVDLEWNFVFLVILSTLLVFAEWSVGFLAVLSRLLVATNRSEGFLGILSTLLVATNFRVHSARCLTRKGRLECVIYVEGARMSALLWELGHDMEYFRIPTGCFKIVVHKVVAEDYSHLDRRLHNLKSMDLTRPCYPSNIRVHLRKGSRESFRSTEVVVCLVNRRLLVDVSNCMVFSGYRIVRASIEYQQDRGMKSEDIDVETLGKDEKKKIRRIERVAIERGCDDGNAHLIVSGPSVAVHGDLMRSLHVNGLVVSGGLVYREFGTGLSDPSGDLVCFVT